MTAEVDVNQWRAQKEKGRQKLQQIQWSGPQDTSYLLFFQILVAICAALLYFQRISSKSEPSLDFQRFQRAFYVVYFLALSWDGLQWPYLHAFYKQFGYTKGEIACLLATYFLAIGLMSPIVGAFADKWGRKRAARYFGAAALLAGLTVHAQRFELLLIGRFSAGIAVAILVTVFEAWMVAEHAKLGYRSEWLYQTFCGLAFGAPVAALASGAVNNTVVHRLEASLVATFDLAVLSAVSSTLLLALWWPETAGDTADSNAQGALGPAWKVFKQDKRLMLLAFLETACGVPIMVAPILWAPTIIDDGRSFPLGLLFGSMAVCTMIGSILAPLVMTGVTLKLQIYALVPLLAGAAVAMAVPIQTQEVMMQLLAFCAFQLCAGAIGPALARLRSLYILEEHRGALIGLLKAPASILVALLVLWGESTSTLVLCTVLLSLAALAPLAAACLPRHLGSGSPL